MDLFTWIVISHFSVLVPFVNVVDTARGYCCIFHFYLLCNFCFFSYDTSFVCQILPIHSLSDLARDKWLSLSTPPVLNVNGSRAAHRDAETHPEKSTRPVSPSRP